MTARDDTRGASATILQVGSREIVVPPGRPLRETDEIIVEGETIRISRADITHEFEAGQLTIAGGVGQLYPYFSATGTLNEPFEGETAVKIKEASTIEERMRCKTLPHYLGWSPGAYLYATVDGITPLGALVISRLPYHMRPKWRRNLEDDEWGGYREAAWIRRVAVREDVQGKGIGTALASASVEYARRHWVPSPSLVESIATESGHGFFLRAGFTEEEESYRSRLNIVQPDGSRSREYRDRYYYWCEIDG